MNEERYIATRLADVLAQDERPHRWLWRKINEAGLPLSHTGAWRIVTKQVTCSHAMALCIAQIVGEPLDSLFVVVQRSDREAA